ncbi:HNH endonuclease [Arthrobacter phage vB_ArS-ArV2]|uniref:HNH endonuclease n=1 Tax=Arthrobacter phage vB_ArS-ArV2 TaxID=1414742 RepID=V5R9A3_9CAUD|nr:HNH endonuclease [Arthrobacter phage vB_ArS-ArV2]AHB31637.1 HNH endonuclease [Arthrobacter phage vB_ArS-ArV2]
MSIVTRVCGRCKVEQPIDQFYVEAEARASARQGKKRKMPCRGCQQRYAAERRAPRQALCDKIKMESGCMDCGLQPKYSQVLEFDHRPGEVKLFHISDRMVTGTVEDLLAEIAKCDVVCANCHRIRTVEKNQFGQDLGSTRIRMGQVYKDRAAGLGHIWQDAEVATAARSSVPDQLQLELFSA